MNKLAQILAAVFALCCLSLGADAQTTRPVPQIDHALIISVDGLRPDVLLRADTPNIHKLFENGSFSFWAQTTGFAITLPSHTSMLTGFTPIRHGIEWNTDLPLSRPVYPKVPTLFEVAKKAGYTTAMAAGKSKFATLNKPGTIDWIFVPDTSTMDDAGVVEHALSIIKEHQPQVMFVHLPSCDNVGHATGWGTPEQLAAVAGADKGIGQILAAYDEQHLLEHTFVLVSSDHGGTGLNHGPDDPRSKFIPWIVSGPGIQKNFDLTTFPKLDIHTEDTFATTCWMLGIPVTLGADGKPITQIVPASGELLHGN